MSDATSVLLARVVLDWRKGQVSGQPAPCVLCGRPALCRSPARDVPCHKGCAEAWITAHAQSPGQLATLIARYTPGTAEGAAR
jgi:hypothetical protein